VLPKNLMESKRKLYLLKKGLGVVWLSISQGGASEFDFLSRVVTFSACRAVLHDMNAFNSLIS
jgi:hypothetical protein